MTADQIFMFANNFAALFWILLAVFPNRRWLTDTVTDRVVPAIFAVGYIAIVVMVMPGAEGGFSSLEGVRTFFGNPWLLLAGWLHYLAFDLLIGTWEARDSVERGVPRWILVPCLFLTLMFGPTGWLIYVAARTQFGRRAIN